MHKKKEKKKEKQKPSLPLHKKKKKSEKMFKRFTFYLYVTQTKVSDQPFILTQVLSSNIVEHKEIVDITWDNCENTKKIVVYITSPPKDA